MINHSFEMKFYGAYYTLCRNVVRGFSRAQRAHKVLKWDFYYDTIYEFTNYTTVCTIYFFTTVEFSKRYNNFVIRYWPEKFLCAR